MIRRRDLLVAGVDALEVADGAGQLVHALIAPGVEHRTVGPETALLDQVCKKAGGAVRRYGQKRDRARQRGKRMAVIRLSRLPGKIREEKRERLHPCLTNQKSQKSCFTTLSEKRKKIVWVQTRIILGWSGSRISARNEDVLKLEADSAKSIPNEAGRTSTSKEGRQFWSTCLCQYNVGLVRRGNNGRQP